MVPAPGRNEAGGDTYWTIRTRQRMVEDNLPSKNKGIQPRQIPIDPADLHNSHPAISRLSGSPTAGNTLRHSMARVTSDYGAGLAGG